MNNCSRRSGTASQRHTCRLCSKIWIFCSCLKNITESIVYVPLLENLYDNTAPVSLLSCATVYCYENGQMALKYFPSHQISFISRCLKPAIFIGQLILKNAFEYFLKCFCKVRKVDLRPCYKFSIVDQHTMSWVSLRFIFLNFSLFISTLIST